MEKEKLYFNNLFLSSHSYFWRRANKLGLRKKNNIQKTRNLIFNLKLIPFISNKHAKEYYPEIKDYFNEDIFNIFIHTSNKHG